ncbi:response regulator [Marinicella meishanensis]|uniref:response regulator n=1 Tax=Marinicella meishanensis TaxID=2873263 RepID=UPI001CC0D0FC|nr:response regulator [Marinicella sp. NBU2979]
MDKNFILVVDDNHINRLFFESSFKKYGHAVALAESGYQAVEMCHHQTPKLILMDIRMDGMDGIETAQSIKRLANHSNTPIIAVSAERFDWQQHPAFCDSLLKPVSQENIQKLIHEHLLQEPVFDQQQALNISHQDPDIVHKLRHMLVQQLPQDQAEINRLFKAQQWSELDALLHKMAGSARVCAASLLLQSIDALKQGLSDQTTRTDLLEQLNDAIQQTISH